MSFGPLLQGAAALQSAGAGLNLSPGPAALVLTGHAPTVAQPHSLAPAAASLALAGHAPVIAQSHSLSPGAAALTLAGHAPVIAQPRSLAPGAAALILSGHSPAIAQPRSLSPAVASVVLTGHAPTITSIVSITPGAAIITISGHAPALVRGTAQILIPLSPGASSTPFASQGSTGRTPTIVPPRIQLGATEKGDPVYISRDWYLFQLALQQAAGGSGQTLNLADVQLIGEYAEAIDLSHQVPGAMQASADAALLAFSSEDPSGMARAQDVLDAALMAYLVLDLEVPPKVAVPPLSLPSAITVTASPFLFQAGGNASVIVSGGTVSLVEFSRDAVTFYASGMIAGMFTLSMSDYLRVTYTLIPIMTFVPR